MSRIFRILIAIQLAAVAAFSQSEPTTPYVVTTAATAVSANRAELHNTILARGRATTAWFEWGTTEALGNQTEARSIGDGTTPVSSAQALPDLQPHTTYYFRAVGHNETGTMQGSILSFTTLETSTSSQTPTVFAGEATSVTSTSAVLNGYGNPLGGGTTAWFEWGTTTAMSNQSDPQALGDGLNAVSFRQTLSNLQPHTAYYFRAVARNSAGTIVRTEPRSFTTSSSTSTSNSPSVATNEANSITTNSAAMNGIVNPAGTAATAFFEWGTSTALSTQSEGQAIASGTVPVTVRQALSGLQPRTTYYFRAVARNAAGTTVRGEVRSFTTASVNATSEGPSVGTNEATAVTSNSAELHGIVNSSSNGTMVSFEWGNASTLINQTTPLAAGNATSAAAFAQSISNLQPNTTYYFRAVARVGTTEPVRGNVRSFTTARVTTEAPRVIPEVEQGQIRSGYVIITPDASSSAPAPTATFGMVNGGNVQAQAGIVSAAMTTDASMFVEVIPNLSRNIGVAFVNPGSSINAVTVTLRSDDGSIVGSPATVSVPAHQQVAQFVNELFGSEVIGAGFRGSLRMQSTTPFAAIGLRFAGLVFSTLPVAALAPVPGVPALSAGVGGANALILPQFAIAGGWATQIALVNNSNATISGRVDIFDAAGNPLAVKLNGEIRSSFTYSIPTGGTFVLAPRDSNGQSAL